MYTGYLPYLQSYICIVPHLRQRDMTKEESPEGTSSEEEDLKARCENQNARWKVKKAIANWMSLNQLTAMNKYS